MTEEQQHILQAIRECEEEKRKRKIRKPKIKMMKNKVLELKKMFDELEDVDDEGILLKELEGIHYAIGGFLKENGREID